MDDVTVSRALKRISHEILEKNNGAENICIIGIQRRGIPLAQIIADNIEKIEAKKVPVGSIDITFYRDDLTNRSRDPIVQEASIPFSIENKVEELFSQKWINDTWENFVECLKSYSNYGK